MPEKSIDLKMLLPAIYRIMDENAGGQLEAFIGLIEDQVHMIKEDIDGLWDDFFIETCASWVVPYIGEIVGNRPMNYLDRQSRVDVAKTIYYRRRKGTLSMLEDLARDVTGWQVRSVAFFENLNWSQNIEHQRFAVSSSDETTLVPIRFDRVGTLNLCNLDLLDRIDGPFDSASRTVDVRPISSQQGKFGINKIGFFLWRLRSFRIDGAPAKKAENDGCYYFSPLKEPLQLYAMRGDAGSYAGPADETDVPGPIRAINFMLYPDKYYGHGKSLAIYLGAKASEDALVPLSLIRLMNLQSWASPPDGMVGVDLKLGRLRFAPKNESDPSLESESKPEITVCYCYGFSSELGGGPYHRLSQQDELDKSPIIYVGRDQQMQSLGAALQSWSRGEGSVIEIVDNGTYEEDLTIDPGTNSAVASSEPKILEIRAQDEKRPLILGSISIMGYLTSLKISGIIINGCIGIESDGARVDRLILSHCTLVPDYINQDASPISASLRSSAFAIGSADISYCITGPMRLSQDLDRLRITDSIIDARQDQATAISGTDGSSEGPKLWMERSTVFGSVSVRMVEMSTDVICTGEMNAEQIQAGCVRFSCIARNSRVPRQFHCVPQDESIEKAKYLAAVFASRDYGHPAYAQLHDDCPQKILRGAEDGSEMGAFNHLKRQKREANLKIRLEEYLPAGLESGIIFVN